MQRRQGAATEAFAQTRRALRHLQDLIEDSDVPRRKIEAQCGFSRGYLAQLLCGHIDLKLSHLGRILDALGETPGRFFIGLYPLLPACRRRPRSKARLVVTRDVADVYGCGVDSLRELRLRLARCEEALWELKTSGLLEELDSADGSEDETLR